jgi:Uncharacterized conserved protein (DUF2278)
MYDGTKKGTIRLLACTLFDHLLLHALPESTFYTLNGAATHSGTCENVGVTENGSWQDGALLIYLSSTQQWTAIFLKFQSQSWQTDGNGQPL